MDLERCRILAKTRLASIIDHPPPDMFVAAYSGDPPVLTKCWWILLDHHHAFKYTQTDLSY
jgi:hypothetical protein